MDDSILVKKCIDGNQKAQRELFEKFAPKMLGVCLRYANSREEAEDVLQDSFVKIFSKLNLYKGGSLEGWIRRIMINTSLDQIRKEKKFVNDVAIDVVDYKMEHNSYILESMHANDLLKLINEMPQGYRTVFNMFAIEGFSHKEIADQLGVTENTSKSQYSRAKAFLQTKMKELGIER
ncbi:MAG: RNA polymerase sigma factor [Fluviicola sp.]|nr:RNA polymerase sigma factor [Fluviicola sp.]